MEHPIPSHQNMLRSTSLVAQTDVTDFFQCLRFDPKMVASDHKSIRQGDLKQQVYSALGIQGDESPSGLLKGKLISSRKPEEIKKLKAILRESNVKARERVKMFNEASSVFNKFFPSIPTKKRSRLEDVSGGRSGDRLVSEPDLGKMSIQGQTLAGGFEFDQQKLDEQPKRGGVRNKRMRTSRMGARSNSIAQQSAAANRDREITRLENHNAVQGEDLTSICIDGWEKSKMRKTRSCIKTDCHSKLASNKVVNGYRDLKQGPQHKSMGDSGARLNGNSNMLRSSIRGGLNSSDFSNTKTNVSVCGMRSGSGLPPKLSPKMSSGVQNTRSPSNWEISGCTIKPPTLSGFSNLKRTAASNRSSSPPATQWAVQRPKRISRIARRRRMYSPIVSSNNEVPNSDDVNAGSTEIGAGLHICSPAASPQLKLKGENNFSLTDLSESEEYGPPEIKSSNEKEKQFDGKAAQSKVSIHSLQSRKNNDHADNEEVSDGVRRKGRTGRGFSSAKSINLTGAENRKNAKQLRSARHIFDRSESQEGCPPARKPVNRRTHNCRKVTATNSSTLEFRGSDIGREELLAAVNSAVDSAHNSPNPFWKQMERYFFFISDDHINFLKRQEELSSMSPTPVQASSDIGSRELYHEELATNRVDSKACPLYQMLLSALIPEDSISINEDLQAHELGAMNDLDDSEFNVTNNLVDSNGCRNNERLELDQSEEDGSAILFKGVMNSAHDTNGKLPDNSPIKSTDIQYDKLGLDEKIILELRTLEISLEPMPSILNVEDDGIVEEIKKLEEAICKEGSKKKEMVNKLLNSAIEMKELQEKEVDQLGHDKLLERAYEKFKASRRHRTAGGKNSNNKISKKAASVFTTKTLDLYHHFEETGKSCFSEPEIKEMFIAGLTRTKDTVMDNECNPSVPTPVGSQPSPAMRVTQNCAASPDLPPSESALPDQTTGKGNTTCKAKKKELLLDDVDAETPLSCSTKGRRSERDRDEDLSRRRSNKNGRSSLGKAGRKPQANKKQTSSKVSPSVSPPDQPKSSSPEQTEANGINAEENKCTGNLDKQEELEPLLDFSKLQIPDGLGSLDDINMPQDLNSWLLDDNTTDLDDL